MKNIVREASDIEKDYITNSLSDVNINVEKVIIHSVTESPTGTEYSVEVHHDEQCTIFVGDKNKINGMMLKQNAHTPEEIHQIITKAALDCELLHKYSLNIVPFIVTCGELTFSVRNNILSLMKTVNNQNKDYYLKTTQSLLFTGMFVVEINSGSNHVKLDRIYDKSIRLTHDSTQFSYSGSNSKNIDINYFENPDDYFALSTVNPISKESFLQLCDLYKVLNSIKYTEYKIKFSDDNRSKLSNKSLFRKSFKEYMKFDLEKQILDEIEREYADYIKVP